MQLVNKKNIEVWKDIPGYEGLYQGISKCCRQQQRTAGGYEWKYC